MAVRNKELARALRRQDFRAFLSMAFEVLHPGKTLAAEPYLDAMTHALQKAARKDAGRLLVTLPPRHLKTITASVALAAWLLGHNPGLKILVVSYGDELVREHSRQFRELVLSPEYRALFPNVKWRAKGQRPDDLRTTKGGFRKALPVNGAMTGIGADLMIIDDAHKAQEARSPKVLESTIETFRSALLSRLNDKKKGSVIVIQQRLHEYDLAGYLLASGSFDHLKLPAIAEEPAIIARSDTLDWHRKPGELLSPSRENRATLERIRQEMGDAAFAAQYQQNPTPPDNCYFRLEAIARSPLPEPSSRIWIIQSWDTAIKDGPNCDYSVGSTWVWDERRWILVDITRTKLNQTDLEDHVLAYARKWRAQRIIVEDAVNGAALVQHLRKAGHSQFQLFKPAGSKIERAGTWGPYLSRDTFAFVEEGQWMDELVREMRTFPNGRHDDQVDSITQFIEWSQRRGTALLSTDPETGRRTPRRRSLRTKRAHEPVS